jgi:hypothetical protein
MKNVGLKQKNFDIDVEYGMRGENYLLDVLTTKRIEVKTDRIAHITGNVAVEYKYKGRPSGISTTEADYWAFLLYDMTTIIMVPTEKLKAIAREKYKQDQITLGGDENASEMILIPVNELTKP